MDLENRRSNAKYKAVDVREEHQGTIELGSRTSSRTAHTEENDSHSLHRTGCGRSRSGKVDNRNFDGPREGWRKKSVVEGGKMTGDVNGWGRLREQQRR